MPKLFDMFQGITSPAWVASPPLTVSIAFRRRGYHRFNRRTLLRRRLVCNQRRIAPIME
jgi:hypothetical protein